MKVTRTQWPVGQGCFATGSIHSGQGEPIQYIYDCGARNTRHLESVVSAYTRHVRSVDALFISHLDGDHVDGLDTLLARLDVKTVYLPYLTAAERLLTVAEAEADERGFTGTLVEAQFEPELWFGRRGVERVVFVNGEGPERFPSEGWRPDGDGGDGADHRGRSSLVEKGIVRQAGPTSSRNAVRFEMQTGAFIGVMTGHNPANWILRPYVPLVDRRHIERFERLVRAALNIPDHDSIGSRAVLDELKTSGGRDKIRGCYDAVTHLGSTTRHNAISMSLYSGPGYRDRPWQVDTRHEYLRSNAYTEAPGWIGTGDAKLKNRRQRAEWKAYYREELEMTGTLLLPHHGSRHNFHRSLVHASNIRTAIAAADERHKGYKHPSTSVVHEIATAKRRLVHVTRRLPTRLIEIITDL